MIADGAGSFIFPGLAGSRRHDATTAWLLEYLAIRHDADREVISYLVIARDSGLPLGKQRAVMRILLNAQPASAGRENRWSQNPSKRRRRMGAPVTQPGKRVLSWLRRQAMTSEQRRLVIEYRDMIVEILHSGRHGRRAKKTVARCRAGKWTCSPIGAGTGRPVHVLATHNAFETQAIGGTGSRHPSRPGDRPAAF